MPRRSTEDVLIYVYLTSAYFSYFEKIKLGLCDLHAVCVSVYLLSFE
jgi:hypothetical protein